MPERLIKKDAKMLFAELYQICGALGCNAKILDNLSAASRGLKPPHKTLLPFVDRESVPAETLVMPKALELVNTLKNINEKYNKSKERVKRIQGIAVLARTNKEEADKQLKEFDSNPIVINFEDEISWIADYYKRYEKRFTA